MLTWIRKVLYIFAKSKNHLTFKQDEYGRVVEQLEIIQKKLSPSKDISKEDHFNIYKGINKVSFISRNQNFEKDFPFLKTLKKGSYWVSLNKSEYEMSYEEYERYFLNEEYLKTKDVLTKTITILKNTDNKTAYENLTIKFSLTTSTIMNTIQESIDLNGFLSNEILTRTFDLLKMFSEQLVKIEERLEIEKKEEANAVNKGLLELLDDEITYMKEYVIRD